MGIEQWDANFKSCSVDDETFHVFDISDWMLEEFFWESENEKFYRQLPDRIIQELPDRERLFAMSEADAGTVLRFRTDTNSLLLKGTSRPLWIVRSHGRASARNP